MYNFNLRADFVRFVATLAITHDTFVSQVVDAATPVIAGMVNPDTNKAYGMKWAFAYMVELTNDIEVNPFNTDWEWVVSLVVVNS